MLKIEVREGASGQDRADELRERRIAGEGDAADGTTWDIDPDLDLVWRVDIFAGGVIIDTHLDASLESW